MSGHFADETHHLAPAERHADERTRLRRLGRVAAIVEQGRQWMIQRDADEDGAQIGFGIAIGVGRRGAASGVTCREAAAYAAKLK